MASWGTAYGRSWSQGWHLHYFLHQGLSSVGLCTKHRGESPFPGSLTALCPGWLCMHIPDTETFTVRQLETVREVCKWGFPQSLPHWK